jgi:hypothetical protein
MTPQPEDVRDTWLTSICCWLPHTWIDETLISAKAAKADDADLSIHLWDQRISLGLERPTGTLPAIRDATLVICGEFVFGRPKGEERGGVGAVRRLDGF